MKYKINLLPQRKKKLIDKTFFFVLNYLRYILVITQLLVIGVFFYRFKVDQDIVDMTEAVTQKQEILSISQPLINQAKEIDYKTKEIKNILSKQDILFQMISYLQERFPQAFQLKDFSINLEAISFSGSTADTRTLQVFYNRLRKEARFQVVQLNNLEKNGGEVNFSFNLSKFILK